MTIICPRCQRPAKTVQTKYGPRNYHCGLASWGDKPLVTKETLAARIDAHRALDALWKGPEAVMTRSQVYKSMAELLGIDRSACHIADLDEEAARRVPIIAERIRELTISSKPAIMTGQPEGGEAMPDSEMKAFLDGVQGAIEATSFEQFTLWEKYTEEYNVKWEQHPSGFLQTVGELAGMPICISLRTAKIGEVKVLFYHATSQVVDNRVVEKWLEDNLPKTARREDGRLNKTDATNSHIVAPFVTMKAAG